MTAHERSGWRDEAISRRHRDWGFNCPAVDLDFLVVEYNLALPVALVEYKHHRARMPNLDHPSYQALLALADGFSPVLPFLIVFYWPETWAFRVHPVNDEARLTYHDAVGLSERRYVESLYHLRRLKVEQVVLDRLHTELPPNDE
jgi:hypothetical protein